MSYILEALKKAQAERQLGSAPTIHAPAAIHAAPVAASRKSLLLGLGAGVLVAAVVALVAWRNHAPAPAVVAAASPLAGAPDNTFAPEAPAVIEPVTPARATIAPRGAAPAAIAPVAPAPAAIAPVAPAPATVAPVAPATVASAPVPAAPRPAAPATNARPAAAPHVAARAPAREAPAPAVQIPAAKTDVPPLAPTVVEKTAAPAPEDNVGTLADLPQAIQQQVPRVAFGGYIYSPNPSDRLLLVDKALRHEGEEVAPGLVLEKLLPKAAVMNYRGYRYRVRY